MCAKRKMQSDIATVKVQRDWLVIILTVLVFPFLIELCIQLWQTKQELTRIENNIVQCIIQTAVNNGNISATNTGSTNNIDSISGKNIQIGSNNEQHNH